MNEMNRLMNESFTNDMSQLLNKSFISWTVQIMQFFFLKDDMNGLWN